MSSEMAEHSSQQRLIALLASEQEMLRRIRRWGNMDKITELLKSVSAELSDPDIATNGASDAKKWVQRVTEIGRDVEDMLEETHRVLSTKVALAPTIFSALWARRRMAKQVKHISSRIDAIKLRLSLLANLDDRESPANATRYRTDDRRLDDTLSFQEVEALGVDSCWSEVGEWLLDDRAPELRVISVVGVAGIGKTTLVRSVYNMPKVRGRFRCHAWITCGAASSAADLLKRIVLQVFLERPELPANADPTELAAMVGRYLSDKPYLVVLDDIWSSDVWDYLSVALADNGLGSRIVVSSRVLGIGSQCWWVPPTARRVFKHRHLEERDSLRLFLRKAFLLRSSSREEEHQETNPPPPEIARTAVKIVRECEGLPLLLVAMGGLMSTKEPTAQAWDDVLDRMHKTKDLQLTLPVVLWLAYNDLPGRLKACFLYFVFFPRTYCAKRTLLIRLWIAEGFVQKEDGKTLEDSAEEYLMELIKRNLVHVSEYYDYGKVKSCSVHDMLREIIILKSEEENFGALVTGGDVISKLGANSVRRLSIVDAKEDLFHDIRTGNVRTILMLGASSMSASSVLSFISEFKLLRVLDLEGAPLDRLPEELPEGLYLRYLSLRNTRVSVLPRSLKKLTHLQTLDLKGTDVSKLPPGITKLQNIRHLLAYRYYSGRHPPYYYALGVTLPQGIGQLRELQKLTYVEANQKDGTLVELGMLTQLKRLGIVKLRKVDGPCLCYSIAKMTELVSLSASSISIDEQLDLSVLDPPRRLERIYLMGHLLELPRWIFSLRHLARIRFRWSRLSEDSIGELRSLPVIELALIQAYDGEALRFTEGFNKLQILEIDHLTNLERMSLGAAMPNIQKMSIRSCGRLGTIPEGVEGLKSLKEMHLFAMPDVLVSSIKEGGANHHKVKHVPVIRIYKQHRDISNINL